MIQELGIMLCKEREKMGEKQKNIADGIIDMTELCRVECGEQEIDYFTLQALFERLGKSLDKLELAVSVSEYESISYRTEIEHSIEEWDSNTLVKLMDSYGKYNDKKRPIHKQYMTAMNAMEKYVREKDYASCLYGMEQALAWTLPGDWRQKVQIKQRLCNQEIRIILVIAYCQWKLGNMDGLTMHLEQLGWYILQHYTDTEEQVKVYPHCAWLLGQLYLGQGRVEEAYAMCRRGKESLIENGSLSPMWEMLKLEETCFGKLGRQAELTRCRKYREAVAFIYEAAGVHLESNMVAVFMKSSFQGEFIITNELVRDLREARGLSQEELSADICTQETLSRIEKGRTPNKKKLYQLLKRMGMERESYYGFIEAADYELYEKVRQYNQCFSKGRQDEATKLLGEIEKELDMTRPVNRQFIGKGHILEQVTQGRLPYEQANQQLLELLHLTMPSVGSDKRIYRVPFRIEYTIWNYIAVNLRRNGRIEEALQIYEELIQCYKRSRVVMRYHAVPGLTLYINYAGFLEEHDELERAKEIGVEGLHHSLECCRGDTVGDILANLSLVYGKQGLPVIEELYLRHGYYLNALYGKINDLGILQKAYQDKFHKEID
ncbi:MAG: helix-turn-helix domain-containing protein [Lachnospiraceae bacterium]|nr:helix-turn-helix domain-containing protein [Lachnospiraceae bacterium]MDE7202694.1 helix-turn-helix domain-containing protein [Lachnospiraceae bacterium]